jgi:hypothetical protein
MQCSFDFADCKLNADFLCHSINCLTAVFLLLFHCLNLISQREIHSTVKTVDSRGWLSSSCGCDGDEIVQWAHPPAGRDAWLGEIGWPPGGNNYIMLAITTKIVALMLCPVVGYEVPWNSDWDDTFGDIIRCVDLLIIFIFPLFSPAIFSPRQGGKRQKRRTVFIQ